MCALPCLTLCDPMDCSLPGSFVHVIFQARILEWVAISSSMGSSPPMDQTGVSSLFCIGRQIHFLKKKLIYLKSKDNCFIELCCFLPNINMNQPQVYICPLLFLMSEAFNGSISYWENIILHHYLKTVQIELHFPLLMIDHLLKKRNPDLYFYILLRKPTHYCVYNSLRYILLMKSLHNVVQKMTVG